MKTEAETGIMLPQAREGPRLPETERRKEPLLGDFRGSMALLTPGFRTSSLQNCEPIKLVLFLATQFLVMCYSSPRELIPHGCLKTINAVKQRKNRTRQRGERVLRREEMRYGTK